MKVIIAGGRDIREMKYVEKGIEESNFHITTIVQGGCSGVDELAKTYAIKNNIQHKEFKAEWDYHGRKAGPIRNKQMADYADVLILIWNGQSRGSWNMREQMEKLGKPIYEVIVK